MVRFHKESLENEYVRLSGRVSVYRPPVWRMRRPQFLANLFTPFHVERIRGSHYIVEYSRYYMILFCCRTQKSFLNTGGIDSTKYLFRVRRCALTEESKLQTPLRESANGSGRHVREGSHRRLQGALARAPLVRTLSRSLGERAIEKFIFLYAKKEDLQFDFESEGSPADSVLKDCDFQTCWTTISMSRIICDDMLRLDG